MTKKNIQGQAYGSAIRGTIANVNRYIGSQVDDYGLQWGQFEYFALIYENQDINQNDLAKLKNVGKASVTKALKILESKSLIIRKPDKNDKRNLNLYATDQGRAIVDKMMHINHNAEDKLFDGFSEDDKIQFLDYLTRIYRNSARLNDKGR